MGTNTDPYQWVEGRYKLMRGIWEALRDCANPCSILTKSPLLLRDLDLMQEIAAVHRPQRVPVGADARREGVAGERAAHAASARAAGGGGGAQRGRHPDRHPDRAADARASTTRPSRSSGSSSSRRRPARSRSAATRCSCAARCAASSSTGCARYRPDLVPRYEKLYAGGRAYVRANRSGGGSSAPPACRGSGSRRTRERFRPSRRRCAAPEPQRPPVAGGGGAGRRSSERTRDRDARLHRETGRAESMSSDDASQVQSRFPDRPARRAGSCADRSRPRSGPRVRGSSCSS